MMRGLGFMEALDRLEPGSEHWTELIAGLMVFRVVEYAILDGKASYSSSFLSARRELARVSDIVIQSRLRDLIFAASDTGKEIVFARLIAYGISLHDRGDLLPAIDVFRFVAESATDDGDVRLQALFRTAFALRVLNRFDDAELAYQELKSNAIFLRNIPMRLEAELGLSRIVGHRGDFPTMERMLLRVAKIARKIRRFDIAGSALIDLTGVYGICRRPVDVLKFGYSALDAIEGHPIEDELRSRVLLNMAIALRELAHGGAANRVAMHVTRTAPSVDIRTRADLLLYDLAIDERDSLAIGEHRRRLSHAHLSPEIAAEYYQSLAREHATFGRFDDAADTVRRMIAVAEEHKLNELIIRGDSALKEIMGRRVPAIYDFRPRVIPASAEQSVRRLEMELLELCPA